MHRLDHCTHLTLFFSTGILLPLFLLTRVPRTAFATVNLRHTHMFPLPFLRTRIFFAYTVPFCSHLTTARVSHARLEWTCAASDRSFQRHYLRAPPQPLPHRLHTKHWRLPLPRFSRHLLPRWVHVGLTHPGGGQTPRQVGREEKVTPLQTTPTFPAPHRQTQPPTTPPHLPTCPCHTTPAHALPAHDTTLHTPPPPPPHLHGTFPTPTLPATPDLPTTLLLFLFSKIGIPGHLKGLSAYLLILSPSLPPSPPPPTPHA